MGQNVNGESAQEVENVQDTIAPRYSVRKTVPGTLKDLSPHPADLQSPMNLRTEAEYDAKTDIVSAAIASSCTCALAADSILPRLPIELPALAALTMLGFAQAPSQKVVLAILKEEPDAPVEQVISWR